MRLEHLQTLQFICPFLINEKIKKTCFEAGVCNFWESAGHFRGHFLLCTSTSFFETVAFTCWQWFPDPMPAGKKTKNKKTFHYPSLSFESLHPYKANIFTAYIDQENK